MMHMLNKVRNKANAVHPPKINTGNSASKFQYKPRFELNTALCKANWEAAELKYKLNA